MDEDIDRERNISDLDEYYKMYRSDWDRLQNELDEARDENYKLVDKLVAKTRLQIYLWYLLAVSLLANVALIAILWSLIK